MSISDTPKPRRTGSQGASPSPPAKPLYLLISLAVLALDQWTKMLIERSMDLYETRQVIPSFFNLTYVLNTGVAFGLFAENGQDIGRWVLTLLGLGALAFVAFYFSRVPADDRLLLTALALVLGGAVGNLLDRVIAGAVTDFIDIYYRSHHWHTFNIADSAITVGIVLMLIGAYFRRDPESEPAP